jgi:hypothetical protein
MLWERSRNGASLLQGRFFARRDPCCGKGVKTKLRWFVRAHLGGGKGSPPDELPADGRAVFQGCTRHNSPAADARQMEADALALLITEPGFLPARCLQKTQEPCEQLTPNVPPQAGHAWGDPKIKGGKNTNTGMVLKIRSDRPLM